MSVYIRYTDISDTVSIYKVLLVSMVKFSSSSYKATLDHPDFLTGNHTIRMITLGTNHLLYCNMGSLLADYKRSDLYSYHVMRLMEFIEQIKHIFKFCIIIIVVVVICRICYTVCLWHVRLE